MRRFSLSLWLCVLSSEGMQTELPFRVGFEFQTNGRLCEDALRNYSIQKRPLFGFYDDEREFLHVVLDGPDIEFVTAPFAPNEKNKLLRCVDLVVDGTNKMMELISQEGGEISLKKWGEYYCIPENNGRIYEEVFNKVSDYVVKRPNAEWEILWQPQMTLQCPLRCVIGLLDDIFYGTVILGNLKEAKPFYNPMQGIEKPLYNTAIGGLIFLLAHEIIGINKSAVYQYQDVMNYLQKERYVTAGSPMDDIDMINDTWDCFVRLYQFDAKRRTLFMSRRPFSEMYHEIVSSEPGIISDQLSLEKVRESKEFLNLFKGAMDENLFYQTKPYESEKKPRVKVEETFWMANYAEQFWDDGEENSLDFSSLIGYFPDSMKDLQSLTGLLKNGILSTVMLRILVSNDDVPDTVISRNAKKLIRSMTKREYYDELLNSVQYPQERLFLRGKVAESIVSIETSTASLNNDDSTVVADYLSPPIPLDETDAMGFYRDGSQHGNLQKEDFGGAVVEIRVINYVDRFKHKTNDSPLGFLSKPSCLKEEIEALYDWLSLKEL